MSGGGGGWVGGDVKVVGAVGKLHGRVGRFPNFTTTHKSCVDVQSKVGGGRARELVLGGGQERGHGEDSVGLKLVPHLLHSFV